MDKNECEDRFSEPETEEHLNGKRDLFEWIKKQIGVTNAVLEGWIPETKQRPDIMFEYNGRKYIIEYQCSPIATEYVERHDLYKAFGIIDIWILGTEKYLKRSMRKKYIQDYSYAFYSTKENALFPIDNSHLFNEFNFNPMCHKTSFGLFYGLNLSQFIFDKNTHHKYISDPNEIIKKQKQRNGLKNNYDKKCVTRHNKYLQKQYEKILTKIRLNLLLLSNKNWKFQVIYFDKIPYIVAEPVVAAEIYNNEFNFRYKLKLYQKVNLFELRKKQFSNYKKCAADIDFLKSLLLPLMKANKKFLLDYKNNDFRFMEVRDN